MRATSAAAPTLIDEWMPRFDAAEHHSTRIHAPAARVWSVVRELDFGRSPVVRGLMLLRGLPTLLTRGRRCEAPAEAALQSVLRQGFVLLEEREGEELLLGVVGRFWTANGGIRRVTADEFRAWSEPGFARATWNFTLRAEADGAQRLATETRVLCTDADSRRRFLRYWRLVGPFSGLIRRDLLRGIRRAAEREG
ncbi:MAG: uncharacterized protein JWM27_2608 [Gemmatimonadetes bacterium]|nr:uncharacterized protein [Gemmatimonadota bacterium]